MLDEKRAGEGIIVSAVHPGEVTTDMNKEHGTIMPDEGMIILNKSCSIFCC